MSTAFKKLLAAVLALGLLLSVFTVSANPGGAGVDGRPSASSAVTAGDINGDGNVNNKDLTRLFQYLSDWEVEVNRATLDINGDNNVNNKDLTRLFQYLSDWDVQIFPEPVLCDHTGATEVRGAVEPTCTKEGYTGDTYCVDCGTVLSYGETEAMLPHVGGVANCHSAALCDVCGSEYGDKDPFNHDGGTEIRGAYAATCVRSGNTGDTYCLGCGGLISAGETIDATGIHLNTEVRDAVAATCKDRGYTGNIYCVDCGAIVSFGEFTEPTGLHTNFVLRGDYPATCTEQGYTGDVYCADCGDFLSPGTYIEPTGHIHTEVRGDYPATCSGSGYTGDVYCADCGMFIDSGTMIEPTGIHLNTYVSGAAAATCETAGYTGDTVCADCGELIQAGTYITPTGHNYSTVTVPVSCTEAGYTKNTCLTCGNVTYSDYVYPTGHTGGVANCHSAAVCEVCGKEYGAYDYNNHDGGTVIQDATEPTDTALGYSGNEICLGCNQVLSYGNYYAKSHVHFGDENATYYQAGICWLCRKEYYAQVSAYDCLNDNQKGFYRRLQNMVYFLEMSQVQVTEYCGDFSTYEDDIYVAFKALSYDRPDMFWIPRHIGIPYSYNPRTGEIIDVYLTFNLQESYDVKDVYGIDETERDIMLAQVDEKVNEVVALTANLDTDFEKEILIHDYICQLVRYDYATAGVPDPYGDGTYPAGGYPAGNGENPLSFTAYGALVNGLAVCEGYSRAMQLICQEIGIPCGLITGYANGGAHMWNIINPGDGCYYLDVTFDDTSLDGGSYGVPCVHTYFNRTKYDMEADHYFDDLYQDGAPLDYYDETDGCWYSLDYNFFDTHGDFTALEYYTATGTYIAGSNAESAANYIIDTGCTCIDLKFDTAFGYGRAYMAISRALGEYNIRLSSDYSIIGRDVIIVRIES